MHKNVKEKDLANFINKKVKEDEHITRTVKNGFNNHGEQLVFVEWEENKLTDIQGVLTDFFNTDMLYINGHLMDKDKETVWETPIEILYDTIGEIDKIINK